MKSWALALLAWPLAMPCLADSPAAPNFRPANLRLEAPAAIPALAQAQIDGPAAVQAQNPGRFAAAASGATVEISQAVDDLNRSLRTNADDETIRHKADLFADAIPGTAIDLGVKMHPWRYIQDRGSLSSASELIEAADQKLHHLDTGVVPPPSTLDSLNFMKSMDSAGKISFQQLPTSVMGVYYTLNGLVGLSKYIPYLSRRMGAAYLAQVLFHEIGGHARDPNIKTGTTDENEGKAFLEQWRYLNSLYGSNAQRERDGDKLVTQVLEWQQAYRQHPTTANAVGLAMAQTANAIFGTQGDADKIKDLIHKLYNPNGTPASTSP